eukprot:11468571-Heterocapsa_arctica.AAC.1
MQYVLSPPSEAVVISRPNLVAIPCGPCCGSTTHMALTLARFISSWKVCISSTHIEYFFPYPNISSHVWKRSSCWRSDSGSTYSSSNFATSSAGSWLVSEFYKESSAEPGVLDILSMPVPYAMPTLVVGVCGWALLLEALLIIADPRGFCVASGLAT